MPSDSKDHHKCLCTETIEGAAGALESIDNIKSSDSLPIDKEHTHISNTSQVEENHKPLCMLSVGDRVANDLEGIILEL